MEWEVLLIEWLQKNLGSIGTIIGKFFSFLGGEIGLFVMSIIILFCWKKEAGKKLILILATVNTCLPMIKSIVLRPRPYMDYPERVKILAKVDTGGAANDVAAQGYSFPSMHSASIPSLYFTLAQEVKKKWVWILAIVLTLLVGIFRVVVGAHYPTDVLAGWALGFAIIGLFQLLDKYVKKEYQRHLVLLAMMLPGLFYVRTNDYFSALGLFIGFIIAIPIEEKYINYHETQNVYAMILRVVGALVIYFALNTILKLPFDKQFLDSPDLIPLLIRTLRYGVIMFVIMGVYPRVFPFFYLFGYKGKRT